MLEEISVLLYILGQGDKVCMLVQSRLEWVQDWSGTRAVAPAQSDGPQVFPPKTARVGVDPEECWSCVFQNRQGETIQGFITSTTQEAG